MFYERLVLAYICTDTYIHRGVGRLPKDEQVVYCGVFLTSFAAAFILTVTAGFWAPSIYVAYLDYCHLFRVSILVRSGQS